jgi:hypothetical protein
LAQDAWIVREQTRSVRRFGEESYASTAVDILGSEIWRLLKRAAHGETQATAEDAVEHRVDLMV